MIWKRTMQMGGLRSRIRCEHATALDSRRKMQANKQLRISKVSIGFHHATNASGLRCRIGCEHATAGDRRGMQLSEQTSVFVERYNHHRKEERKRGNSGASNELLRRVPGNNSKFVCKLGSTKMIDRKRNRELSCLGRLRRV